MRILVFSQYFYPENFRINDLCSELVKRGHEVTVLTGYPNYPKGKIFDGYGYNIPYDNTYNGVNIIRINLRPRRIGLINLVLNYLSYVKHAKKWVNKTEEKFDLCYVFAVSPITVAIPAILYKKKYKVPVIINLQDLWPDSVRAIIGRKSIIAIPFLNRMVNVINKNCDKFLCSSKSYVEILKKRNVDNKKLIYWPQYSNDMISDNDNQYPLEYSKDYFNVVFTGNIGETQGLDVVINAAKELDKEKIKIYLIGDGRYKIRLMKKAEKKGLNNIIFVNQMPSNQVVKYIKHADCCLLTLKKSKISRMVLPAKLQTYMQLGKPIIASCEGEVENIINESKCGFVNKFNDYKSLANNIKLVMNLSEEEINTMEKNSFDFNKNNFDKEQLLTVLEKELILLHNIISKESVNE